LIIELFFFLNPLAYESSKRDSKKVPNNLSPAMMYSFPEQSYLDASIRNQGNRYQTIKEENKSDWNSEVGILEKIDCDNDSQKLSSTISSDDILKLWRKMKKKRS